MGIDLCVLFRRPPYGNILAAEGIRHLIGAVANGLTVGAVLVDNGVWVAKAGQTSGATGWTSLGDALAMVVQAGHEPAPQILADQDSLTRAGLGADDLIPGVKVASPEAVAEVVATARHVLIF